MIVIHDYSNNNSPIVWYLLPLRGNLYNTSGKQGTVTSTFTYDEKRRLTTISDSSGNVVSYTYNDSDRIASMTLPGGQT